MIRNFLQALAALTLLAMAGASCDKLSNDKSTTEFPEIDPINLTKAESEVLEAGLDFNFDLLRNMYEDGKGVFLSPLSLQAALSMALNGAAGETFEEMAATMGYDGCTIEEINSLYNTLIKGLAEVDTSVKFEIANSMWINKGFELYSDYVSTLKKEYSAECEELDFNSPDALSRINKWCSDNTHGLIDKILDELDPGTRLILMNALYFKASWSTSFEKSATREQDFTASDGKTIKVKMMHKDQTLKYAEDSKAQFLALPFGNKAYELDILLPSEDVDFDAYVANLDSKTWENLVSSASKTEVITSVPKISMDNTVVLMDALEKMGIHEAFSSRADFSGISKASLVISEIRQRAVFKMDEEGAEAAAVTIIDLGMTDVGPDDTVVFTADHPFIFAIRETTSNALLFLGTYTGL